MSFTQRWRPGGRFVREDVAFRNWITTDGSAGPSGSGGFKGEADRYHLYVSLARPWAHRALIMRALKGLEDLITVSVVHWLMLERGWSFSRGAGVIADTVNQAEFMHEIYTAAEPHYTGRVTVPVLWDKRKHTIVNDESSEIIRMFYLAFDGVGAVCGDYYLQAMRTEIDAVKKRIYDTLNNGVYKAGFATTQDGYEEAVIPLLQTLDWLEQRLADRRFLFGNRLTEADIRLFTTLIRFDVVYFGHFKCNIDRLVDYPNLSAYACDIYQWPGVASTVNFNHIKRHYYESHRSIDPPASCRSVRDSISPVGRTLLERVDRLRAGAGSSVDGEPTCGQLLLCGAHFFLGDAYHPHSPFGRFGMNLYINDALGIGWKIAATLQGWEAPSCSRSYELAQSHPSTSDRRSARQLRDHRLPTRAPLARGPRRYRPHHDSHQADFALIRPDNSSPGGATGCRPTLRDTCGTSLPRPT